MLHGYNNRIGVVDLTSNSVSYVEPDSSLLQRFLGGRGLGCAILYKHARNVDPLSENSLLCVLTGPVTGSGIPLANRLTFVFRSPQTGTIAWANTGGYAGTALKSAGLDAIVVKGRAERPVYLLTENSSISILDASGLWGRGAIEVVTAIRHQQGDARVLAIGPAGEKLVTIANVVNDTGRTSGVRHGVGCVMGSKLIKAIVIKGDASRRIEMADRTAHLDLVKSIIPKIRLSPLLNHETGLLAVHGTPIAGEFLGKNDAVPVKNYQTTVLENYNEVGGRQLTKSILISRLTCSNCPVGCRRETAGTGAHSFRVEGPDYSQISALGTNCFVTDLEVIGYMNYLCYEYGLDPIEMGNELALLAELTERGAAKEGLRWGDTEMMIRLIRQTAYREGMGDAIAKGPDELATQFGFPELSMSVKGITVQNTDPRVEPAWGLLNATENFGGAEHIWVYADLVNSLRESGVVSLIGGESTPEEIARAVKYKQDLVAVLDSLQVCAFSSYAFSVEDYVGALNNIAGSRLTTDDLMRIGEGIFGLEKRFNLENGLDSQDTLPSRFLEEPLPVGKHEGKVCDLQPMLREYHGLRKNGDLSGIADGLSPLF